MKVTDEKIVRCRSCSTAAWLFDGCGFTAKETLICTERGGSVKPGDGCTFGTHGKPGRAVRGYDVDIGGHAAIRGSY